MESNNPNLHFSRFARRVWDQQSPIDSNKRQHNVLLRFTFACIQVMQTHASFIVRETSPNSHKHTTTYTQLRHSLKPPSSTLFVNNCSFVLNGFTLFHYVDILSEIQSISQSVHTHSRQCGNCDCVWFVWKALFIAPSIDSVQSTDITLFVLHQINSQVKQLFARDQFPSELIEIGFHPKKE